MHMHYHVNLGQEIVVVTRKSGAAMLKRMETGKPTDALRDLMRD